MTQSDSAIPPPEEEQSVGKPQRKLSDPFDALFNSLFSLPKSIYDRGNDHGRAFTRRHQEEEGEKETDPIQARREYPRREGRHARHQDQHEDRGPMKNSSVSQVVAQPKIAAKECDPKGETEMDEWVMRITADLERGEREAKQLYEQWVTVSDNKPPPKAVEAQELPHAEREFDPSKPSRASGGSSWANIFPSWSSKEGNRQHDHHNEQHILTEDTQNQPKDKPDQNVDETVERLHKDIGRWLGDAEQWRLRLQKDFERDSRLWQDKGLLGPSTPFSKPLSTLFGLGMRPFLPEQSAMGYLLYSEYSPLHLEHEKGFDSSFRKRFEDLLRVEDGKAMLTEKERSNTNQSSIVDWLGRLIPLLKVGENGRRGQITIGSASDRLSVLQVHEQQTPFDCSKHVLESNGERGALHDHQTQLKLLEPQLKKQLFLAREEQDKNGHAPRSVLGSGSGSFVSTHTPENDDEPETEQDMYERDFSNSSQRSLIDQQMQLLHFDQMNKKRLLPTRHEPDQISHLPEGVPSQGSAHFSQRTSPSGSLQPPVTTRSTLQGSESPNLRPDILSTLTQTEHHVDSDGTVTTKTVLKKRFADGSEENSEIIETTPTTRSRWREPRSEQATNPERTPTSDEGAAKKGWFWSS